MTAKRRPEPREAVPPLRTEIAAGVTTFFTTSYIVVVNPAILSTEGTGMPFAGVMTATVVLCFVSTLLMGLYARLPFVVAPGMGINAFFTFSVILGKQVPWPTALGMVFWSGVLFMAISATPVREIVAKAIPMNLRSAIAAGIGLFLTLIGLRNLGLVVSHPVTFVTGGPLSAEVLLGLAGLAGMAFLLRRKSPFAFLAGIFFTTSAAALGGLITLPESLLSRPDFGSVFLRMDLWGALKLSFAPTILALLFTDLFDSISTFIGVSQATGMVDRNGDPKNLREGLIVDAFATLGAGLAGTSSGTAYIESASGIEVGGRTGRTAVVCALCFLPCLFVAPLAGAVPGYATAPVLILVGALMFRSVAVLKLAHIEDAVPAFLTLVLIPMTSSITQGILWGFVSHAVLYLLAGRRRELSPVFIGLAVLSVGLLALEQLG